MIKIEVKQGALPQVIGIGAILTGVFLAVMLWNPDGSLSIVICTYLFILIMIASGICMCMDAKNRKMTVEDEKIGYTNWFGKKRCFMLEDIGYCKTALEKDGSKDYIKLYDKSGKALCKIEYNMKDSLVFLHYLLDNQIRVECSKKSDSYLQSIIAAKQISKEETADKVNEVYEQAKEFVREWTLLHKRFGAEWKMGIVVYPMPLMGGQAKKGAEQKREQIPEQQEAKESAEYQIVIEGYLQKDGQFVFDKKERAVSFGVLLVTVSKSWQIGQEPVIRFWGETAIQELSEQLAFMAKTLPRRRYHTGEMKMCHELSERL